MIYPDNFYIISMMLDKERNIQAQLQLHGVDKPAAAKSPGSSSISTIETYAVDRIITAHD